MPELPEVEVVRAGLEPAVTGARVTSVTVFDERSLRRHDGPREDFIDRLTGIRMLAPERRGKFLWIPLSAPASALVVHLGMSGQVLLRDRDTDDPRTRIRLELEHPEHGPLRLNFVDQRIFGSMAIDRLVPTKDHPAQSVPSQVAHIARDPLDEGFDDEHFFAALARRRTGVKRALLDQTLVSGIGNIYADEALWAARVHYNEPTDALSRRAVSLLSEVRAVFARALAEGGTSFDTQYLQVNGESGYFARSLNAYGRQGLPCPRCGRPLVRERFMNRGSHFCAKCQPVRRAA
ncbi:MAG: bifunctional DNA-formamidopyrimidine glycosylase/DNA-(apurinic or apyrimidinic site) lyase [Salinibacterium sp.]|nr:MAG: bifunctional DNA-formamidopyrimidine glycosylase/DNA-(apurinic or apyrimidinic site) lyase [Salinibacterium sp.]